VKSIDQIQSKNKSAEAIMVDLEKTKSQLDYLKKMNDTLEGQNQDLRSQLSQEKESKAYAA
jgi:regulator of replication initiation timing